MKEQVLYCFLEFSLFVIIQALVINGIHFCFSFSCTDDIHQGIICKGNVFYKLAPKFFQANKGKTWTLPLYGCVRCMSSVWGTITYWPVAVYLFGFNGFEIFVWMVDILTLVSVTWVVYKKL